MTNDQKAAEYDRLLREHDKKSTKVSSLQNKIDQTSEDKQRILELKREMAQIQYKAANLGSL
jgi:hypothetical protein|tara:strand:+ start:1639 stop:1824 length:186 start_codon:yes stop_codon:yes gene_type:complete